MKRPETVIIPKPSQNQNGEKARRTCGSCLKELTHSLSELKIYLIAQNAEEALSVLHAMSGAADIMHSDALTMAIRQIHDKAKKGVLVSLDSVEVDNLHIELNRLKMNFKNKQQD